MGIGNQMETIAENLTDVYGAAFVRGRLQGYNAGYEEGYQKGGEAGHTAGFRAAEAECLGRHYTASVLGNDAHTLSFPLPFYPDVISIYSINPYSSTVGQTYKGCVMDLRDVGMNMGAIFCTMSHNNLVAGTISQSTGKQCTSYNDGIFTFGFPKSTYPDMVWAANVRYTVSAVKYPGENTAELIREQIAMLPDQVPEGFSGELVYHKDSILRYYAEYMWQDMIAAKPAWTFVLK